MAISFRDRGLRRAFSGMQKPTHLNRSHAEKLIAAAQDGPGLSKTEAKDLQKLLADPSVQIDDDARALLTDYLEKGGGTTLRLKDKGLRRAFEGMLADGRIGRGEADALIAAAEDGPGLSKTEKKDLKKLLSTYADKIDSDAKQALLHYIGEGPAPLGSLDDVKARLTALKDSGQLDEASLQATFTAAKQAGVTLSAADLKALHDAFGSAFVASGGDRKAFFDAALPALGQPVRGGAPLMQVVMSAMKGDDDVIQREELGGAVDIMMDYFIGAGLSDEDARIKTKHVLLGELGLVAGGQSIHKMEDDVIVALATSFGDPLEVHTKNLQRFITDRVLMETRGSFVQFAKGLDPQDPVLVDKLERATSFADLMGVLEGTGQLDAAVQYAGARAEEPYKAAFDSVAGKSDPEIAQAMRALDNPGVLITDVDEDGQIGKDDLVTIVIGQTATIRAVDVTQADELAVAKAMQDAVKSMTTYGGASKFDFFGFPPKFNQELFSLDYDGVSFKLKPGVKASDAIKDIVENSEHYKFECATAIVLTWHIAQYELFKQRFGDEADAKFDEKFKGMKIGPWRMGPQIRYTRESIDPETDVAMAGEWRYFKTWDVDDVGKWRGWQGENVIYIGKAERSGRGYKAGDSLYFGHPFGVTSGREIVESLNEQRFNIKLGARAGIQRAAEAVQAMIDDKKDLLTRATLTPDALAQAQAEIAALQERHAALLSVTAGMDKSKNKRAEVRKYLDENRSKIRDADNAQLDARIKDGPYSDSYREALKKYEELTRPLNEGDEEIDRMDLDTLSTVNRLMAEIELALKEPGVTDEMHALLNQQFAALKEARPKESSLVDWGLTLQPTQP